jgi:hypothetical protein
LGQPVAVAVRVIVVPAPAGDAGEAVMVPEVHGEVVTT